MRIKTQQSRIECQPTFERYCTRHLLVFIATEKSLFPDIKFHKKIDVYQSSLQQNNLFYREENSIEKVDVYQFSLQQKNHFNLQRRKFHKKIDGYWFSLQQKNHFCEKENSIPKTNILAHFLLIYSLIAPQIFSSFMEIKSDPKLF